MLICYTIKVFSGYIHCTYIGISAPNVCSNLDQHPHNGYVAIGGCINQRSHPITFRSSLVVNRSSCIQEAANNVWREKGLEAVETQKVGWATDLGVHGCWLHAMESSHSCREHSLPPPAAHVNIKR